MNEKAYGGYMISVEEIWKGVQTTFLNKREYPIYRIGVMCKRELWKNVKSLQESNVGVYS